MHVASTRGPFPFRRPNCIMGNEKRFLCGLAFSGAQARGHGNQSRLYVPFSCTWCVVFVSAVPLLHAFENAKGTTDLQIDGDCFLLLSCPLCFHMWSYQDCMSRWKNPSSVCRVGEPDGDAKLDMERKKTCLLVGHSTLMLREQRDDLFHKEYTST